MHRRLRRSAAVALVAAIAALALGACGINAEDRPTPIAPTTTTPR